MRTEYPDDFFKNRKIYWLYATRQELVDAGVHPVGVHTPEDADYDDSPCPLSSACMTQEEAESFIPKNTYYCYTGHGETFKPCPFWDKIPHWPTQSNGFCYYLRQGDCGEHFGLLWDQCKECGKFEDNVHFE